MVRYSRANFLVLVPQVRSLDELNARVEESCREDLKRRLRGHGQIQGSVAGRRVGRDAGVAGVLWHEHRKQSHVAQTSSQKDAPADDPARMGSRGIERLTVALLDRLTHRVHIIEANGESYRLKDARKRRKKLKEG